MLRQKINDNWKFSKGAASLMDLFLAGDDKFRIVNLPHDAMIEEKRDPNTKNSSHTGFYPGNVYTYFKELNVPSEWADKTVYLEFEGVSNFPKVYINGDYAGGTQNPYNNFYIKANPFLKYGEKNLIKVESNNMEQTSRWYPGGGIYRDVRLMVADPCHLSIDGLRIKTLSLDEEFATIEVKTVLENHHLQTKRIEVEVVITDQMGQVVTVNRLPITAYSGESYESYHRLSIERPKVWSAETPYLYNCCVKVYQSKTTTLIDEEEVSFGVRTLQLSAQQGLRVNGQVVKLRGTCLHHDNGIIGATTLAQAEERRIRQLKEAGFNCIRSSHHPISKSMLEACDRLGMYVIDELWDMWTQSKNPNDYAMFFANNWQDDVKQMVAKDYNHPSVIMYSLGNEIQEAGTAKGAEWNRKINNLVHELDNTRYTTNGLNGLIAGTAVMGEILSDVTGLSMEELAGRATEEVDVESLNDNSESSGANEWNGMMSMMMGDLADAFATNEKLGNLIEEFVSGTDIAGYNYLTALHEVEKDRHLNRVVLGTETFPSDIVRLWNIVENNNHVIGDMTWIGYDYLGEAGCGIFYYDGTQNFTPHWPDRLAYIGDIDITGYRRPIGYLREIVYGLRKEPYIAVKRLNRNGQQHSITPWMWKDNVASWTWAGYEGEVASVDVYALGSEVELFLNGKSLGRKTVAKTFVATYDVPYQAGLLEAVVYNGEQEVARTELRTASKDLHLSVIADKTEISTSSEELVYIDIFIRDAEDVLNMQETQTVTVAVEGVGELQGFGSADPQALTSYQASTWETYDGHLLLAIRSKGEVGEITVNVSSEKLESQELVVFVKEKSKG